MDAMERTQAGTPGITEKALSQLRFLESPFGFGKGDKGGRYCELNTESENHHR